MEDLFRGVETSSVRDSFKSQCHFLHFGSGDAHKSFAALSLSPRLHSQHFPSRLHHHNKTSAFEVSFIQLQYCKTHYTGEIGGVVSFGKKVGAYDHIMSVTQMSC